MSWLLTWPLVLAIPATQITTCTMGSDDAWAVSLLLYSPVLAIVLLTIVLSRGHHGRWLWLAVPHAVFVPLAVAYVWPFLVETSLGGHHLCAVLKTEPGFDAYPASSWQRLWAPVQLVLLAGLVAAVVACRQSRADLRLRAAAVACVLVIVTGCATRPPTAPHLDPATERDLSRAESFGKQIYELDRAAALATDEAARRGLARPASKVRGWIVEPKGEGWLVRFVAIDGDSYRAAHDVFVPTSGPAVFEDGATQRLSPDEAAMFRARQGALAAVTLECSRQYNTVVLRDPDVQGGGWIVYVLAATSTTGEVVLGRHHRVRVSADGRAVLEDFPLSKSCLRTTPGSEVPAGADVRGVWTTHVVSSTPTEAHVFLSLLHRLPLFVRTSRGTWRVADGRIHLVDDPG